MITEDTIREILANHFSLYTTQDLEEELRDSILNGTFSTEQCAEKYGIDSLDIAAIQEELQERWGIEIPQMLFATDTNIDYIVKYIFNETYNVKS